MSDLPDEDVDLHKQAKDFNPKDYVEAAFLTALARVKLCEKRLASLQFAVGTRRGRSYGYGEEFQKHHTAIHVELYRELNDAYSNLFMFGLVSNNPDLEKKAVKMAHERYLREGMSIMGYLNPYHDFSGSYSTLTESEFRADIVEKLIERGLDPVDLVVACPECHAYKGQSCRNKKYQKVKSHKKRQLAALEAGINGRER